MFYKQPVLIIQNMDAPFFSSTFFHFALFYIFFYSLTHFHLKADGSEWAKEQDVTTGVVWGCMAGLYGVV